MFSNVMEYESYLIVVRIILLSTFRLLCIYLYLMKLFSFSSLFIMNEFGCPLSY
jgi:hypothetical protein